MIASVGPCLPADLFEATGRYAGPLPWQLGRPTPKADRWLESMFPVWARSVLEDWAQGRFDELAAVVFSRADDAAQRLYYYVCELQRRGLVGGPRPTIVDVAKIPRPTRAARSIDAVRRLAREFALSDDDLRAGIAEANRRRAERAAIDPEGPACILVGTPPPHRLLHEAISDVGFSPVGPTLAELWADPGPPIDETEADPAAAIGRQIHLRHDDRRGFADAARSSLALAQVCNARAAVLWYGEEDEARAWDVPRVQAALANAGLPLTVMTRRDEAGRDGAPAEIRAFLGGLKP